MNKEEAVQLLRDAGEGVAFYARVISAYDPGMSISLDPGARKSPQDYRTATEVLERTGYLQSVGAKNWIVQSGLAELVNGLDK